MKCSQYQFFFKAKGRTFFVRLLIFIMLIARNSQYANQVQREKTRYAF